MSTESVKAPQLLKTKAFQDYQALVYAGRIKVPPRARVRGIDYELVMHGPTFGTFQTREPHQHLHVAWFVQSFSVDGSIIAPPGSCYGSGNTHLSGLTTMVPDFIRELVRASVELLNQARRPWHGHVR